MQYVNTLQPKYSSIDLTEVELPETEANSLAHNDMERENDNSNMLLDVRIYLENIILRFVHLLGTKFGLSLQNNVFIHFVVPTFKMLQHFPFDFPLSLTQLVLHVLFVCYFFVSCFILYIA